MSRIVLCLERVYLARQGREKESGLQLYYVSKLSADCSLVHVGPLKLLFVK